MNTNDYIYIENDSLDVYYNFALEYYLTSEKLFRDKTVFLIWRTTPTVMVGKFQNTYEEINQAYVYSKDINVVRRMSGGGTIFTDLGGWQFTFIALADGNSISFREYTEPIIEALKNAGVDAYYDGRNDILVDGKKVSGNAQYMRNGFVVHHGSLLYSTDLEMLERSTISDEKKLMSKGIKSVRERVGNISDFIEKPMSMIEFRDMIIRTFIKDESQRVRLTADDHAMLLGIAESRFNTWQSIYGRNPEFEITKTGRCTGGDIKCRMNVVKGRIDDIQITGNFFGNVDMSDITGALKGCMYKYENVRKKLDDVMKGSDIMDVGPGDLAAAICGKQ